MNKKLFPLAVFLSVCVGLVIGTVFERNTQGRQSSVRSVVDGVYQIGVNRGYSKDYAKLNEVLTLINTFYVDTINTDKVTEDILPQVLHDLDPHSVYIPAAEVEEANEDLNGSFSGIGVSFSILNDTVTIVDVIAGGPSEKLGILPGDRIVEVGDSVFTGEWLTNTKVMKTLRGPKGTQVKVGIVRKDYDKKLEFTITRGDIPVNSVDVAYMLNDSVGYVKVSRFGANTYTEFVTELNTLRRQGCRNYIVDLRGNSGGYLNTAIQMINEFLSRNKLIVYTEGKIWPRDESYSDGKGSFADANLCVLINEWSASASEIFAGAIQDQDRGWIVGRRSFGKGLVQQPYTLKDGSELRLTIARYYTPSGRCIQKPYAQGEIDTYDEEILKRFDKGEFFSADSISFADSLKYTTSKGRTVYGGGGIMPDFFIGEDTTRYTDYYRNVVYKGLVYEFAFNYADENRQELSKYRTWRDIEAELQRRTCFDEFVAFADKKGEKADYVQVSKSKTLLENLLIAYISRNIMGDAGFYPIFNQGDATIEKAIEVVCTNVE